MFLQKKKGDMVITFVMILVITIAMIFVVTAFGSRIISSLYPSGDKSTVRSFDALYNVINMLAMSNTEYDVSSASLYLKKGYCVILFDSQTVSDSGDTYYAPEECRDKDNQYKQCICLYDGSPRTEADKKEKNLIKCDIFSVSKTGGVGITLDPKYRGSEYTDAYPELNPKLCSSSKEVYTSLLIVRNTIDNIPLMYIFKDSDENQKLVDSWEARTCPNNPNDPYNICIGKKDGAIVVADTEKIAEDIGKYCSSKQEDGQTYISTSAKCNYNKEKKLCLIDCKIGDVSEECNTKYKTCSDFNNVNGLVKHLNTDLTGLNYFMCKNDATYCKRNCEPQLMQVYNSRREHYVQYTGYNDEDGTVQMGEEDNSEFDLFRHEDMIQKCKLEFSDRLSYSISTAYLTNYDSSTNECNEFVKKYFYTESKKTVLECNGEANFERCMDIITAKDNSCDIFYFRSNKNVWITYYQDVGDCDSAIKEQFREIYVCTTTPQNVDSQSSTS